MEGSGRASLQLAIGGLHVTGLRSARPGGEKVGTMQLQDVVVGLVAIAAGLFLVVVGVVDIQWYFQSWKTRWLDDRLGRLPARLIVALLGILLVLLGIAIISGFAPNAGSASA